MTDRQTDGQTDGSPGKNNMSHDPEGGDIILHCKCHTSE